MNAPPAIPGWFWSAAVFVFGSCVGSFLNVCIYRIPRGESVVTPASRCPICGNRIAWHDNIPIVSFLLLRGVCRHCSGRISPRYPLVETLTALLFLAVWLRFGPGWLTPIYWLATGGLIVASFVDLQHMIIPDRISMGGILAGLFFSVLFPEIHGQQSRLLALGWSLAGAATGASALWAIGVLGKLAFRREAMGWGDVKLLGAIGAFLGWPGVVFSIVASSVVGSIVGIYLIFSGQSEWQGRIPYGPYLALGAMIWILWGPELAAWYQSLVSF